MSASVGDGFGPGDVVSIRGHCGDRSGAGWISLGEVSAEVVG